MTILATDGRLWRASFLVPCASKGTVASKSSGAHDSSINSSIPPHIVQLFDAPRSLADAVSHFVIEGRAQHDQALIVARASHWQLIRAYLERRGVNVDDPAERIVSLDARKVRHRMMRRGVLDPARLEETLDGMIAEMSSARGHLRIYGEIVELFAEEGNFEQACALEDYWNHLQHEYGFTLLCGYSSAHFADPRNSQHLRDVCSRHSSIRSQSADSLGTWLTAAR
jgi:DcmR-like sensory protein